MNPGATKQGMTLRSLRVLLGRHVMWPLALTWTLGTVITLAVSLFFTQQAFDRALLDDAYAIASRVSQQKQGLTLELSTKEMGALLFDQSESVFFSVQRQDGSVMAGHPGLRAPVPESATKVSFADITYQGKDLRSVTLSRQDPEPFVVVVAQTQGSRAALLRNVLLFSVVPQVLLLLGLAWWLRSVIGQELAPLSALQRSVDERDASDLTPLPVSASSQEMASLGNAINALLERVSRSLQAQREFSGNVAHELRTPLAGIRALTEYGLAHDDPAVWREQLQRIAASEGRASRLVEQLLALALAEESDVHLPIEPVDLEELTRNTVLRYLPRADALGVDLGLEVPSESTTWPVLGHAALIEGILGNLLDNALRYGRPAQGVPTLTVALMAEAGVVKLLVLDNGLGLSASEREAVLQRGVRVLPQSAPHGVGAVNAPDIGQGAGLGLAIVSKFAGLMHARFALHEVPGSEGLCASVTFVRSPPLASADSPPVVSEPIT